jgi:hypothetical protein
MKRARYRDSFDDLDSSEMDSPPRSSRSGISTTGLLLIGLAVASGVIIRKVLQQARSTHQTHKAEQQRDKTLKDTYPASDPPASQYFDIPVNRQ